MIEPGRGPGMPVPATARPLRSHDVSASRSPTLGNKTLRDLRERGVYERLATAFAASKTEYQQRNLRYTFREARALLDSKFMVPYFDRPWVREMQMELCGPLPFLAASYFPLKSKLMRLVNGTLAEAPLLSAEEAKYVWRLPQCHDITVGDALGLRVEDVEEFLRDEDAIRPAAPRWVLPTAYGLLTPAEIILFVTRLAKSLHLPVDPTLRRHINLKDIAYALTYGDGAVPAESQLQIVLATAADQLGVGDWRSMQRVVAAARGWPQGEAPALPPAPQMGADPAAIRISPPVILPLREPDRPLSPEAEAVKNPGGTLTRSGQTLAELGLKGVFAQVSSPPLSLRLPRPPLTREAMHDLPILSPSLVELEADALRVIGGAPGQGAVCVALVKGARGSITDPFAMRPVIRRRFWGKLIRARTEAPADIKPGEALFLYRNYPTHRQLHMRLVDLLTEALGVSPAELEAFVRQPQGPGLEELPPERLACDQGLLTGAEVLCGMLDLLRTGRYGPKLSAREILGEVRTGRLYTNIPLLQATAERLGVMDWQHVQTFLQGLPRWNSLSGFELGPVERLQRTIDAMAPDLYRLPEADALGQTPRQPLAARAGGDATLPDP